jgi:UDP-N-acetylglucosamine acyltransferase
MLDIHATAVVDPRAELDSDVTVGPYTVIGGDVRIAAGTRIGAHAVIEGHTSIGRNNTILHGAVLGAPPQDLKFRGEKTFLRVGDGNTIREYATLNLACIEGETTEVGDRCLLMAYVHIAHNCRIGNDVILANSVNLAGHVEVQDHAIIGGVTPVHQFVRVGRHVIIGGGSRVPKDVPPFVCAAGNPLRLAGLNTVGLERRGFDPERRARLKQAYRILFRSETTVAVALDRLRAEFGADDDIRTLIEFFESSQRGVER